MNPTQIAERIEDMFEGQLDGGDLHRALRQLQVDLIGKAALKHIQDVRTERIRARGPSKNRFVTAEQVSISILEALRALDR